MKQSSFNAFGQKREGFGGRHIPVWLGTVIPYPVGGSLAKAYVKAGLLLPAGTPIQLKDRVITPALVYTVKAYASGVLTIDPSEHPGFTPGKDMYVKLVGDTIPSGEGVKVTASEANAATPSQLDLTATVANAKAGSKVIISAEAGVTPNAYLNNDIYLGDIDADDEGAGASGAAVMSHAEGILIDRTPSAGIAAAMKAAVPGVIQVNG